MKKLLALLLSLLTLLTLTACGANAPDYDTSFTIFVNGEESWTPFPGKTDVVFTVSKDNILALRPGKTSVDFTGSQVGKTVITAKCDGKTAKARVEVKEMQLVIAYQYTPPQDNYHIESKITSNGYSYREGYAKIGDEEAMFDESNDWRQFSNISTGAYYTVIDGHWYEDVQWGFYTFVETGFGAPISSFHEFYEQLSLLGDANSRIQKLYQGSETVCGVECWVFETKGTLAQFATYWVDPQNGCCLKKASSTGDTVYEITTYDLNYTEWDADMHP